MKISRYVLTFFAATAALGFTQYSSAANNTVTPEAEPVDYVRVCDAYGVGYYYIPGTDTCLRVGGQVYSTILAGSDVYARSLDERDPKKWRFETRAIIDLSTATDTELGTLRSFARIRGEWGDTDQNVFGSFRFGYIELGGLRVGLDESAFNAFLDYYGDFINDDVTSAGGYKTNLITYTYNTTSGFSAVVSLEQGNNSDIDYNGQIKDYMPHVVLGAKYTNDLGFLAGVAAYDSVNERWFGKAKVSVNVTDKLNVWGMAAYKDMKDTYYRDISDLSSVITDNSRGIRAINSFYGTWGGSWSGWLGASYAFSEKNTGNLQFSYEGAGNFYTVANIDYKIASGLTVVPEVGYRQWNDTRSELKGKDALYGAVRITREF